MKNFTLAIVSTIILVLIFGASIDLNSLDNYENQPRPDYITKDNTPVTNSITDKGATLGRVLFYDKQLSLNSTVACGSCHKQEFAFSDTASLSRGLSGGSTGRHSMRLVNSRFAEEVRFFWNERAASLELQTTQPIQDHVEMGYSGTNGQPGIDSLIRKLQKIDYYNRLFSFVYGDSVVTEERMQQALAQFVRSIQSFDSKFDAGLAQTNNLNAPFPNFTQQENMGKMLFLNPPAQNGAGCQGCHRAPEFDIDPASLNNGVIGVAGVPGTIDLDNTRAPSLRDVVNPSGQLNGPLMHNGIFASLDQVINHYNLIPQNPNNTNLDPRLAGPGGNLQLAQGQRNALVAFLRTLTGSDIYTNPKRSDPFEANGNLALLPDLETGIYSSATASPEIRIYPNPAVDFAVIQIVPGDYVLRIYDIRGQLLSSKSIKGNYHQSLEDFSKELLIFEVTNQDDGVKKVIKVVKE